MVALSGMVTQMCVCVYGCRQKGMTFSCTLQTTLVEFCTGKYVYVTHKKYNFECSIYLNANTALTTHLRLDSI